MTGAYHAVIDVDLTYEAESARRAGATEVVDQIVTGAAVLAGIRLAIVDIELAVLTLETLGTLTLIRTDEVLTCCAVLTRCRVALVDLLLAVRAGVALEAMTTVTVAYILAGAVVAEILFRHALPYRGVFARNHLHVAHLAGPSGRAIAVILVLQLHTRSLILARTVGTPIHICVAMRTRIAVRTMTGIVLHMIVTGSAVLAGRAVALINTILTVGPRVAMFADARVVVDTIDAIATVHAATFGAVFVVGLAIDAGETAPALARIGVDVFLANRSIPTRLR